MAPFRGILIAVAVLSMSGAAVCGVDDVLDALLPRPRVLEQHQGILRLDEPSLRFRFTGVDTADLHMALGDLRSTGMRCEIQFAVLGRDAGFDRSVADDAARLPDSLGGEAYLLRIEPTRVLIGAHGSAGLFYGAQTLLQLVDGAGERGELPCLSIIDWPSFRYRGVMDDISRGPVPTTEYIREQIRRLARMKVNLFTHYVEHVVATKSHPGFAPPGGSLSIEEWRALAVYARRYHITLVGGFQSFGHFQSILAHPEYAHLGEGGSLLSPVLKESYDFLADVYREMVPAFSAPWFHTDCDETFDLGKGASKSLVDSIGKGRVYVGHVRRLHDTLATLGVRTMIWGDILLQHPEVIDELPGDLVVVTWNYDNRTSFADLIEPLRRAGSELWVAPGVLNSRSIVPNFLQAEGNIRGFLRDASAYGLPGVLTTVWDDGGTALFGQDWYGVALAADQSWHVDPADTTFARRFDRALHHDLQGSMSAGLQALMAIAHLTPTDNMNDRILATPPLPPPGGYLLVSPRDWDAVDAAAARADSLFAMSASHSGDHDRATLRYTAALYRALARNRLEAIGIAAAYRRAVEGWGVEWTGKAETIVEGTGARPVIVDCLSRAGACASAWETLGRRFAALWLHENRTHALDKALEPYRTHAAAWRDLESRLFDALARLDRGESLPLPVDCGLDVREIDGWYFREWVVTGPLDGGDLHVDYLASMGGEAAARPAVTQEFTVDGATHRWRRKAAVDLVEFRFEGSLPDMQNGTFYAYATLESPRAFRARFLLGSVAGVRMFVNGDPVHTHGGTRRLVPDTDECHADLRAGSNTILVKVTGRGRDEPGFTLRLPDVDVRNSKNRYRILSTTP